jgi:hypothetical protein
MKQISSWSDARDDLEGLARVVRDDVTPLFSAPGSAPHTISREWSCYVDHLGHLYTGWSASNRVGDRFRAYLRDVLSLVDPAYGTRADVIYKMYRTGPVHEFDPKVLKNSKGQVLGWMEYVGSRDVVHQSVEIRHLKIAQLAPGSDYVLPVSTQCLVEDLVASIRCLIKGVGLESERVAAWNAAVAKLNDPEEYEFAIT